MMAKIGPVLSGLHSAVCYVDMGVKYVVAGPLCAAHHPSIHHVQAVKTHLSGAASCTYIHL